jgi:DNA-nicking Smr family endonuclease
MKLDLHGIKHENVSNEVDRFIWEAMQLKLPQVEIVTGNSEQMKTIVYDCVSDYGFVCSEGFMNWGALIVTLV